MIKSVVFFKRKPGMPVDEFQAYWLTRHPDVVTGLPGIRRYVQSHTLPSIYAKREPVYDGIAELWTDDMEALRAMVRAPHYERVKADEAVFIDGATMGGLVAREHVIVDGPAAGIKSIGFVTRRPDLPSMRSSATGATSTAHRRGDPGAAPLRAEPRPARDLCAPASALRWPRDHLVRLDGRHAAVGHHRRIRAHAGGRAQLHRARRRQCHPHHRARHRALRPRPATRHLTRAKESPMPEPSLPTADRANGYFKDLNNWGGGGMTTSSGR
jgi:uncharacterized protein (TIGR02118 family)